MNDAQNYLEMERGPMPGMETTNKFGIRLSIPTLARLRQLYCFGHSVTQIVGILQQEFSDVDVNPITPTSIKKYIDENRNEFEAERLELANECRDHVRRQIAHLFSKVEAKECRMVDIYVQKMDQALDQLLNLDFDAKDANGNYINTSRHFVLFEIIEKLQSKISKIVGTDALREIEIYKQRMEAKANAEKDGSGHLPPMRDVNGKETKTQWI